MALSKCRECGKEVSSSARVCPHCGVKEPTKEGHIASIAISVVVGALVLWWLLSGGPGKLVNNLSAGAKACEVQRIDLSYDVFITNGEPDLGVIANVTVKKLGAAGAVRVFVEVSSSEGTFAKERLVQFGADQVQVVPLQFLEPTINAGDTTGRAWCET